MMATSKTALVIVHLSSLDSYTHQGYESMGDWSAGEALASNIAEAIRTHKGPVYIVNQGWELGHRESRPREWILNTAFLDRWTSSDKAGTDKALSWITFDESTQDWDVFEKRLVKRMKQDGITSVIVGGIWYDPLLKEGCATETYLRLRKHFKATVDESITGCDADLYPDQEEES